jgi:hypothetical protein
MVIFKKKNNQFFKSSTGLYEYGLNALPKKMVILILVCNLSKEYTIIRK